MLTDASFVIEGASFAELASHGQVSGETWGGIEDMEP
jgi:hypothetical protein